MKGTSGEEWVTPLEKVMKTYTLPDGSAIESTDFIPDEYIEIRTISELGTNLAMFIPVDTVVIVETAWGDVLTANNPLVVHGEGDYLVCNQIRFSRSTSPTPGIPLNTVGIIPASLYPSFRYMARAFSFLSFVSIRST